MCSQMIDVLQFNKIFTNIQRAESLSTTETLNTVALTFSPRFALNIARVEIACDIGYDPVLFSICFLCCSIATVNCCWCSFFSFCSSDFSIHIFCVSDSSWAQFHLRVVVVAAVILHRHMIASNSIIATGFILMNIICDLFLTEYHKYVKKNQLI